VHCVSGTPGRVNDMCGRQKLRTRHTRLLVLDEADEMLNMNFQEQIYNCYRFGGVWDCLGCFGRGVLKLPGADLQLLQVQGVSWGDASATGGLGGLLDPICNC
jgi:hypothetical protein